MWVLSRLGGISITIPGGSGVPPCAPPVPPLALLRSLHCTTSMRLSTTGPTFARCLIAHVQACGVAVCEPILPHVRPERALSRQVQHGCRPGSFHARLPMYATLRTAQPATSLLGSVAGTQTAGMFASRIEWRPIKKILRGRAKAHVCSRSSISLVNCVCHEGWCSVVYCSQQQSSSLVSRNLRRSGDPGSCCECMNASSKRWAGETSLLLSCMPVGGKRPTFCVCRAACSCELLRGSRYMKRCGPTVETVMKTPSRQISALRMACLVQLPLNEVSHHTTRE